MVASRSDEEHYNVRIGWLVGECSVRSGHQSSEFLRNDIFDQGIRPNVESDGQSVDSGKDEVEGRREEGVETYEEVDQGLGCRSKGEPGWDRKLVANEVRDACWAGELGFGAGGLRGQEADEGLDYAGHADLLVAVDRCCLLLARLDYS